MRDEDDEDAERARVLGEMARALRGLEVQRADHVLERHRARRQRMNHWYNPGAETPWWTFALRFCLFLVVTAGIEGVADGRGWHFTAEGAFPGLLGLVETGWRARGKVRARRGVRAAAAPTWEIGR